MPNLSVRLGNHDTILRRLAVKLLVLLGTNCANLWVLATPFALGVEERVDVKTRGGGAAAELAEFEDEFLLEVVGEVVLSAEEDDASLGDCSWLGLGV